jgi:hypothetical protein
VPASIVVRWNRLLLDRRRSCGFCPRQEVLHDPDLGNPLALGARECDATPVRTEAKIFADLEVQILWYSVRHRVVRALPAQSV